MITLLIGAFFTVLWFSTVFVFAKKNMILKFNYDNDAADIDYKLCMILMSCVPNLQIMMMISSISHAHSLTRIFTTARTYLI